MTLLEKKIGNIPSAPGLNQFTCMTPSTFTICIQDKKLMKWNITKPSKHFENLNKILPISYCSSGTADALDAFLIQYRIVTDRQYDSISRASIASHGKTTLSVLTL